MGRALLKSKGIATEMKQTTPTPDYFDQKSDRLNYRLLTVDDIEKWAAFFIDNPSQRFVGADQFDLPPIKKAENWITRQIDRLNNNEFGQLAVIESKTGKFVGVGGLISRELEDGCHIEVTYSLLPSFWNNGYATELALHFKQYAKENADCDSVISIIHLENEASMNVARKNGMKPGKEITFLGMAVRIFEVKF